MRPPTSGTSATTAAPPAAMPGRRSRWRPGRSSSHGLDRASFDLVAPEGSRRIELALPGLYNVYNALAAAALARALGSTLDEIAAGLGRFSAAFGRFERIQVGDKRILLLLIKNPAGGNEVVRTLVDGGAPRLAVVALNDGIADGRDVSWIWDVDFEPLLEGLDHVVATGERAAELALRFAYGGLAESRDRGRAEPRAGPRPRAGAHRRRTASSSSSRPTLRCSACSGSSRGRGLTKPYWEQAE